MYAAGWMSLVRLVRRLSSPPRRSRLRSAKLRKTTPGLESLESISLLSAAGSRLAGAAVRLHDARDHRVTAPRAGAHGTEEGGTAYTQTLVTLPPETTSLGNTLTDFAGVPLSPPLNLFNPSLGTLVSVTVMHSATLQSNITSQNLSTDSTTTITASLSGMYQIDGLNQPIAQPTKTISSQPMFANISGLPGDTVTFPTLQLNNSSTMVFSDPASLAFFTASPGRSTITPTMTATASASASAPDGNLFTSTQTSASAANLAVSYMYLPTPCPTTGKIGRIGVHHQRTLLILPFNGTVDPAKAADPADYHVITRAGRTIPIVSADFNPATNSVTLRPAVRLNVHDRFKLWVRIPCPSTDNDIVTIPFGTKYSLIGFHNHKGQFIPVRNGRIVRFDPQPRSDRPGPVRSDRPRT
jgi:hypothetical protein